MDVSYQLYSSRNFTPWSQVLGQLADLGYTQVEGFGGVYEDPAGFRTVMDDVGLTMPSGHFALADLESKFAKVDSIADSLGISKIYCPFLMPEDRPKDAAGWMGLAKRLEVIGKRVTSAGYNFGWHNHDFEFEPLAGGQIPMKILLDTAPNLGWEADIAWIARAGADPMEWIKTYGHRITAAHVKDIAPNGQNLDEDGWADLGLGMLDWGALMAALQGKKVSLFIMEHDNPSDMARFARNSITAFQTMIGVHA